MKGFTKTIAAFCAMAMIFGAFSATVFADESDVAGENVASGEAVDGAQQEEGSSFQKVEGQVLCASAGTSAV